MKIEYHKNPLYTKIILDEHEQEIFKLKIRLNELTEAASQAHFELTHHEWHNSILKDKPPRTLEETMKEAASWIEYEYLYVGDKGEPSGLDKRTDEMFKHFMSEITSNHVGDCTCVACSCSKCHAESILEIDTIPDLSKQVAHKINCAFGRGNEKTMEEALESLLNYDPKPAGDHAALDKLGGWQQYAPRWKGEAAAAYAWLLNYRNTHFKD